MRQSCTLHVKAANGKDSILYDHLKKNLGDSKLANVIYAYYKAYVKNTDKFDNIGRKDNNGEHLIQDVTKVMDLSKVLSEQFSPQAVAVTANQLGIRNPLTQQDVVFTDYDEVLEKTKQINDNNIALVATIKPAKAGYTIALAPRTSFNFNDVLAIERKVKAQKILNDFLKKADLSGLPDSILPQIGTSILDTYKWLKDNLNISDITSVRSLRLDSWKQFVEMEKINNSHVQRLLQKYNNSVNDVAELFYHLAKSDSRATTDNQIQEQIKLALAQCLLFDSDKKKVINELIDDYENIGSTSTMASQVFEILTSGDIEAPDNTLGVTKTHTLVQTASTTPYLGLQASNMREVVEHATAILEKWKNILQRNIRYDSKKDEAKAIENITRAKKAAEQYYQSQQYAVALSTVLDQLIIPITSFEQQKNDFIKNLYNNPDATTINELCTTLNNLRSLLIGLQPLINIAQSLLVNNFDEQYSTLKMTLDNLNKTLIKNSILIQESKNMIVRTLFYNILEGERNPYSTFGAINISLHNTSMWDFLYSISESPDQNTALIGQIIRKAQDARIEKVARYADKINKATQKLRKAGIYDTKWMYEAVYEEVYPDKYEDIVDSNGKATGRVRAGQMYTIKKLKEYRIISDIDWDTYYKAQKQAFATLQAELRSGKITFEEYETLKENWIINNTELAIVDTTSSREERIPSANYRKTNSTLSKLSLEQREYYDTMIQIRGELDTLLPSFVQDFYKPVQIRKNFKDMIAEAHGAKDVWEAVKKKAQDLWVIREDDTLFIQNSATKNTVTDIAGNKIKEIPIFYINSLKDQTELMMDFSGSMLAYLGQAVNYDCMSKIRETVLFLRNELVGRPELEKDIPTNQALKSVYKIKNTLLELPVIKSHITNVLTQQNIIDAYIDSLLFGKYFTQSKWLKLVRALTSVTSSLALTFNHTGATANLLVGLIQVGIESVGAQFYNPKDLLWAYAQIFGDSTREFPTAWSDYFSNDLSTKSGLLKRLFDYKDDSFRKMTTKRYYRAGQIMQEDLMFKMYGIGEEYLHALNMYAILRHEKVQDAQGKTVSLYDAFSTKKNEEGIVELNYEGYKYMNDQGEWVNIDEVFIEKIRKRLRYVNHATHGAMNQEDKGIFSKTLVGILAMNLRQWMVGHYSRRFRSRHYSADLEEDVEGFHRTMNKFVWAYFKKWILKRDTYNREMMLGNLTEMEKANLRRALAEDVIFILLLIGQSFNFGMGPMGEVKESYWKFFWLYQLKRLSMEVQGSTPMMGGVFVQGLSILNSPIAGANTVKNLLYPFYGLLNGDITDTVKQGDDKGSNKYLNKLKSNCIPYYKPIYRMKHLNENEQIFRYLQPY